MPTVARWFSKKENTKCISPIITYCNLVGYSLSGVMLGNDGVGSSILLSSTILRRWLRMAYTFFGVRQAEDLRSLDQGDSMQFSPAILLVRPQMGENIGAVARAMSNFGLKELRLIAPRDGWPNEKAYEMATEAGKPILDKALVYNSFAEGMADVQLAYATTARPRELVKPVLVPSAAMHEVAQELQQGLRVALVFGPERSGLENDEVVQCNSIISIPVDAVNPSLNLAQSAVIVGYEWFQAHQASSMLEGQGQPSAMASSAAGKADAVATKADWQGLFDQLEGVLDACNYFRKEERKPLMWRNIKNILGRSLLSQQEVRTLRGMVRSLSRSEAIKDID